MAARHVLLHQNDRLGMAIEASLLRAGCQVTKLPDGNARADLIGEGMLESVSILVLSADDDAGNVDLALTVRRLRPDLPAVVRVFDEALAAYLRDTLDRLTILSMSGAAAPAFAEAAVRVIADRHTRGDDREVPDRTREARIRPRHATDRIIVGALGLYALIVTVFTLLFSRVLHLPVVDALYFVITTVTSVGYGDIALRDTSPAIKIAGMVMMIAGPAFIAVFFGLFTDWVVSRRLEILSGRVRVRGHGHVVIAGGGNVGFRVAERLRALGHRVAVIERDGSSKNVEALRAGGVHVIVGDASRTEILDLAAAGRSAAVLCLTDLDAVNVQISLLVRAVSKDVPIILRVVSPELSAHVSERGDASAISPIAIASEAFSVAALRLAM